MAARHRPFIYFDSVATSQRPRSVIDAETNWYETTNANIHRGVYALAEEATVAYERVRSQVAEFLNASDARSIVFTKGTTEGINLITQAWARPNLKRGDVILVTEMEHHANIVPWQQLAKEKSLILRYWPIDAAGKLVLTNLTKTLAGVKLLSLTHVSNVLGTINPIENIIRAAQKIGVVVVVDAAQSIAHLPIDIKKLKPDFLVFSGHKMYGPTGIGVAYVAPEHWDELQPYQTGGDMISRVDWQHSDFKPMPGLLEAGTPPLAQVAGLGAAVAYLQKLGWPALIRHEKDLTAYAYKKLSQIPGLKIYGPSPSERGGVIAFTITGLHAHDLASWLDERGFCVRAGHHCAQPLHQKLNVPATARIGLSVYNSKIEVDALASALTEIIKQWPTFTTR